ncbi:MAG TPA: hypothetical protein VFE61_09410 [Candidatus Sulfotelmatobacter sp.]|jgi:hypothetical protein|nr:hypothetical protein [Candidatus Sulfotelmatobacter sp.]
MSEDRRKRQQEREGGSSDRKTKNLLIYGGIAVLLAAAYFAGWHYKNHKYDAFAQCLAAKQAKMYGLYWCPHCIEQKEMFGAAFHNIPYVECAIKGSSELAPQCKVAGVKMFPSWQFGMDPPKEGEMSLEALSDKTGCSLP